MDMNRRSILKGALGFLGLLAAPGGVADAVRSATAPPPLRFFNDEFQKGLHEEMTQFIADFDQASTGRIILR